MNEWLMTNTIWFIVNYKNEIENSHSNNKTNENSHNNLANIFLKLATAFPSKHIQQQKGTYYSTITLSDIKQLRKVKKMKFYLLASMLQWHRCQILPVNAVVWNKENY